MSDYPLIDFIDHGPLSSQETFETIAPTLSQRRQEILSAIIAAGAAGMTLDELSVWFDVSPNVISGRITELKRGGLVRHTKERRRTRSGCTASVLVATEAAR